MKQSGCNQEKIWYHQQSRYNDENIHSAILIPNAHFFLTEGYDAINVDRQPNQGHNNQGPNYLNPSLNMIGRESYHSNKCVT